MIDLSNLHDSRPPHDVRVSGVIFLGRVSGGVIFPRFPSCFPRLSVVSFYYYNNICTGGPTRARTYIHTLSSENTFFPRESPLFRRLFLLFVCSVRCFVSAMASFDTSVAARSYTTRCSCLPFSHTYFFSVPFPFCPYILQSLDSAAPRDRWILSRLNVAVSECNRCLNEYK